MENQNKKVVGIGFFDAWKITNVPSFAFGFFCVKGIIYGVLFWLPLYLSEDVGLTGVKKSSKNFVNFI